MRQWGVSTILPTAGRNRRCVLSSKKRLTLMMSAMDRTRDRLPSIELMISSSLRIDDSFNPPIYTRTWKQAQAAWRSFCFGVMPPKAMFGHSVLYRHSH